MTHRYPLCEAQAAVAQAQLPSVPPSNFIIEPVGRDTAACLGYCAIHIEQRDPGGGDCPAGQQRVAGRGLFRPLDVLREMEQEKVIGKVHERFYTTTGVATKLEIARRMGQSIAARLKADGVSGVILTST